MIGRLFAEWLGALFLLAAAVATVLFKWLLDERSVELSMARVRESAG